MILTAYVDWEYPKSDADKIGFTNLLVALKKAFAENKFLLSAAVPCSVLNTRTAIILSTA